MYLPDSSPADRLRHLIDGPDILLMPCCFDALSARLVQRAGFPLTFMSGFAVSATRLGLPDTGLISYGEVLDQGRGICEAVDIPVIGDGDTGYGNAINVKRTVAGYARAGFAGVMIEDQKAPKRCGHTAGKEVVDFDEACTRIQAALDAREEGSDILIMARTDAAAVHGIDEALRRAVAFADLGADILFVEAPQTEEDMRRICAEVPNPKMVNLVEQGDTPFLSPAVLQEMGFKIAAYPLTALMASVAAMENALATLKDGQHPQGLATFEHLRDVVGFPEYYAAEDRYRSEPEE